MNPVGARGLRLQLNGMLLEHLESLRHPTLELWVPSRVQVCRRLLHRNIWRDTQVLDVPLARGVVETGRGRRDEAAIDEAGLAAPSDEATPGLGPDQRPDLHLAEHVGEHVAPRTAHFIDQE